MNHREQFGFLTIAQNNHQTDYLKLAYLQALSIKAAMPDSRYAVIVDSNTHAQLTEKQRTVFDYVIELENDYAQTHDWKLANEWQAFYLTPFKETIKLESDILVTSTIQHWIPLLRQKEMVMPVGCLDYQQQPADSRAYRKLFDDNALPDVYTGFMYFRYSKTAADLFKVVQAIYQNWDAVREYALVKCHDQHPTTDVVFAIAAQVIGPDLVTIPSADFVRFVHMKSAINQWPQANSWQTFAPTEIDIVPRINNVNQYSLLHYHEKSWATDEIIKYYEQSGN